MKHARDDYNRIQDPAGLIPEDEPVFLLRAQDKHAAATLRYYAHLVALDQGDVSILFATQKQADAMEAWPRHKAPDMPALDALQRG
jgi:hypothetical protein